MWVLSSLRARTQAPGGRAHPGQEPPARGEQLLGGEVEGATREGRHRHAGPHRPRRALRSVWLLQVCCRAPGSVMESSGPCWGNCNSTTSPTPSGGASMAGDELLELGLVGRRDRPGPPGRPTTRSRWRTGDGSGPASGLTAVGQVGSVLSPQPGKALSTDHRDVTGGLQRGGDAERTVHHHAVAEDPGPVGLARSRRGQVRSHRRLGRGRRRRGRPTAAVVACGGPTVPATTTTAVDHDPHRREAHHRDVEAAVPRPTSRPGATAARPGSSWHTTAPPSIRAGAPAAAGRSTRRWPASSARSPASARDRGCRR